MNETKEPKALETLLYVSRFQNAAQAIERFDGNPYVKGDNIAEHLARLAKLLICIAPKLHYEFPDYPLLFEQAMTALLVHDDDEVIDGFDIPTALKEHNVKDDEEIEKFKLSVADLSGLSQEHLISAFSSFRKKDSLAAAIAKALDNIAGNQLVIEQEIGLINPDQAKFAIEYVEKVRGISPSIDALIEAQIGQIISGRQELLEHLEKVPLPKEKAKALLEIDLRTHVLDKSRINIPLEQL